MKILAPEDAECLPLLVPAAGPGAAELGGGPEDLQVHEGRLLHPQDLFQLNKFFYSFSMSFKKKLFYFFAKGSVVFLRIGIEYHLGSGGIDTGTMIQIRHSGHTK